MVKRGLIVFCFILGTFLFMNFVSAEVTSCSVTSEGTCGYNGGTVVMRLSNTTNAHGAVSSYNSYQYVLCCYGTSSETTSCTETGNFK